MPIVARYALVLMLVSLVGCSESVTGTYEAFIQVGEDEPQHAGVAVIQKNRILADRQVVDVAAWEEDAESITALDAEGKRLARFFKEDNGVLIQALPQSKIIYKRLEL